MDSNVFIDEDFSRGTLGIWKELWGKRCTKNEDFPLRISPVNVTKSSGNRSESERVL